MKEGDTVSVKWDLVPGEVPPYSQTLSAITDDPTAPATVMVRAMQTKQGKGASKPSETVTCSAPVVNPLTLPGR